MIDTTTIRSVEGVWKNTLIASTMRKPFWRICASIKKANNGRNGLDKQRIRKAAI